MLAMPRVFFLVSFAPWRGISHAKAQSSPRKGGPLRPDGAPECSHAVERGGGRAAGVAERNPWKGWTLQNPPRRGGGVHRKGEAPAEPWCGTKRDLNPEARQPSRLTFDNHPGIRRHGSAEASPSRSCDSPSRIASPGRGISRGSQQLRALPPPRRGGVSHCHPNPRVALAVRGCAAHARSTRGHDPGPLRGRRMR